MQLHSSNSAGFLLSNIHSSKGRRKKIFFNGSVIKAFNPPPPSSVMAIRTFFVLKNTETDFDNFWT